MANASSRVSIQQTSFSSINVDLATATETAWDNRLGEYSSVYYWGVCDIVSADGYTINSVNSALACLKKIKYAGVSFSPYENTYRNTTHMRLKMVHEIGHALGLDHPTGDNIATSADSVMR